MDYRKILAELALRSPCRKKFGVIVLYRGKIVGKGFNYVVGKFSVHAEEAAIHSVRDKRILPKCSIILARLKEDTFVQCKCCDRCHNKIQKAGISKVHPFTTDSY